VHAVSTLGPGYFMLSLFMASRQSCTLSPISLFLILDRCPTARRSLEHLFFIPSHPNIITDPLSCHLLSPLEQTWSKRAYKAGTLSTPAPSRPPRPSLRAKAWQVSTVVCAPRPFLHLSSPLLRPPVILLAQLWLFLLLTDLVPPLPPALPPSLLPRSGCEPGRRHAREGHQAGSKRLAA